MRSSTASTVTTASSSSSGCGERVDLRIRASRDVRAEVGRCGFALVRGAELNLSDEDRRGWEELSTSWDRLAPDRYFGAVDTSCHRVRRYRDFTFVPRKGLLEPLPPVPYFQSLRQNVYAGGIERRFSAVEASVWTSPFFCALVAHDFAAFPIEPSLLDAAWTVHVHQIRIVAGPQATTPVTPEGVHSDGYPFAAVHLVDRVDVTGGESTVYDGSGRPLATASFEEPLDSLFFLDRDMKHYVTPITGCHPTRPGRRSILAVSFSLPGSQYFVDA